MRIRPAEIDELHVLQGIERAAGECFREIGMPEIADDAPLPVEILGEYRDAGRAWVAADEAGHPVAYMLMDLVDNNIHIEQVSVNPHYAHRRIGRSLIDHASGLAADMNFPALTLTTFRDVPWNKPYYERCGFRCLGDDELTPGLRAVREREAQHGLDRWPRVSMRRELRTS
ncbi:GNAT family N-acetyltransferase [Micromonospora sp. NPDC005324]|uniref:GNAT family N-acetyltransferase n=1 Tax=Micromonospora sp. NPDC005324 TaxID=3157033 RepID=UPI0033B1E6C9